MWDFLQALFGGNRSGSQQQQGSWQNQGSQQQQGSESQSRTGGFNWGQSTSTPGNYNPFTALFGGGLADLIGSIGNPFSSFMPQGPYAAGMSEGEGNVLGSLPQGFGSSPGATNYINDLMSGKYLPGGANFNSDTLNSAITAAQRPTLTNLNQVLSQDLPSQFIRSGQFVNPRAEAGSAPGSGTDTGSTAFDTAAGRAVNTAAQTIGDIASKMSENVYNTERQLQQGGVQLSQGELQGTIANLQAQSLPRMIEQYGIDQGTKVFQSTVGSVLDFLKTMGGITAPSLANASMSTNYGNQFGNSASSSFGTGSSWGSGGSFGTGSSFGMGMNNPFSSLFGGGGGGGFGLGNLLGWLTGGGGGRNA